MKSLPLGKLSALLLLMVAYLGLYQLVPPRHRVESHWGECGVNWFGQSQAYAWLWAVVLLALLYLLRCMISRWARSRWDALAWYALLVAVLLPGIWLLVVTDWDNEAASERACWVGTPIALLVVPTAFLCWDIASQVRLSVGAYLLRSLVELVCVVPIWLVVWVYCELLLLGWIGV